MIYSINFNKRVNGNLKTAIARKLAEIEEYQKNLRDQKNQNIKEVKKFFGFNLQGKSSLKPKKKSI